MTDDQLRPDQGPGYEGTDGTGAVRALVDPYGVVIDVRLARDWRKKMHRNELGAAVLAAIDSAGAARVSSWVVRAAAAVDTGLNPATAAAPRDRAPVEFRPVLGVAHRLLHLVDRVDGELRSTLRNPTPTSVTGASAGGHITIRFTGRQVVGVDIDAETNWTVVANHPEIESELADALNSGYIAVTKAERSAAEGAATAELWALTADPRQFVDELFGARRP